MEILFNGRYDLEDKMRELLEVLRKEGFEIHRRADDELGGLNFLARKEGETRSIAELLGEEVANEDGNSGFRVFLPKN